MDKLDYSKYSCGSHLLEDQLFLSRCQVDTPTDVVDFFWRLISNYRDNIGRVADLGAGDGRFAKHGSYDSYIGYEVDGARTGIVSLPLNAKILNLCAFGIATKDMGFNACVGNPPYVKHHDIDSDWHIKITSQLKARLNIKLKRTGNLFTLFLAQAIAITNDDGLVAQIIPYEWTTRPSTQPLRDLVEKNGWAVDVYRFKSDVFPRVLTTACVTIIDKADRSGKWSFYEVDKDFGVKKVRRVTGSRHNVLAYTPRGLQNYAQRGLSPGGNKTFCITEGERLHHGLEIGTDVHPCLISMKPLPNHIRILTIKKFQKYYADAGERCWIIDNSACPSKALLGYLDRVPESQRDNFTCNRQSPWWAYKAHDAPSVLYNPGFVTRAPHFVDNQIKAIAVGSVFGIHSLKGISKKAIVEELSKINFKERLISYARTLRRVEVNQMNTVIGEVVNRHGK